MGRIERRRIWSVQEQAALLAEVDAEGGKVRLVARRHRISESLLYNWLSARKVAAVAAGAPENVAFVPVGVIESADSGGPEMLALSNPLPSRPPSSRACRQLSRDSAPTICMAARRFLAVLSWRVAMARNRFAQQKKFSIRWRAS